MFGFDDILGIGGALLGAAGSKKDKPAEQKSAFESLPKEVQEAWLKTFLPQVLEQNKQPYKSMPMGRYQPTGDIFENQGLKKLQEYSDSVGGLFSPYGTTPANAGKNTAPPVAESTIPADVQKMALANQFINSQGMGFLNTPQGQLSPNNLRAMGMYEKSDKGLTELGDLIAKKGGKVTLDDLATLTRF